jgi:DNA polymerase elongation subunit (family B)
VYRNAVYLPKNECLRVFTWDSNGNRTFYDATYHPYLYIESNNSNDIKSIFNTNLKKINFKTQYDRNEYLKRGVTRVFENTPPIQQFLIDTYWEKNEDLDFAQHPVKVYFLDIETYSPDEFPIPDHANHVINIITVYNSLEKHFYTWGLKSYTKKNNNHTYVKCNSEEELLQKFINYIELDYPDILSGWNSEFFDIPYIINRIKKILGDKEAEKLSPVLKLYPRSIRGKYGKEQTRWHIEGISVIDYLDVYKRFCMVQRENYKLNSIAEIELGEAKVDYGDTNLSSLSDENWEMFVDYNLQDVVLLVKLEDKLRYVELLRMLAYTGLTTFEAAMGSLSVITGATAIRARYRQQRIPTFIRDDSDKGKNPGAYVSEPQQGFQEHIVSFDANSLYPNTMISLNLSPETKMGKIEEIPGNVDEVIFRHVNGNSYNLTKDKLKKLIDKEKLSISKSNVLFSQNRKGIIPEIVDRYYQQRVEVKSQLKKIKQQLSTVEKNSQEYRELQLKISRLNIKQHTIKIFINTIYGYFGNKHAPIGDDDLASSITLTGQAVIKQCNDLARAFIKEKVNQELAIEPIIYNDTDSVYITLKELVNKNNINALNRKGEVSKDYHQVVNELEDFLNKNITVWGSKELNSLDCRFIFKREAIADVGLFLQKKRYILHLLDEEGIPCDKFKYTGVEVVRTTMPTPIKPYVKKIIKTMLTTKNQAETNKILNETYDKFKELKIEDIAFVSGIKNYEKYSAQCDEFKVVKGMPNHVKAAYFYNLLVRKYKIDKKYEMITSGDKIRFFYVQKPNPYGLTSIAFKYYNPKEFSKIFQPDYELMFNKIIFSAIERLYDAVGWRAIEPGKQVQCDLFELLS